MLELDSIHRCVDGGSPDNKESLKSKDVIGWLRSKEVAFYDSLTDYAKFYGYGFDYRLPTIDERATSVSSSLRDTLNGGGYCGLASGVIEHVLREKYKEKIDVCSMHVSTFSRDTHNTTQFVHGSVAGHYFVLFRVDGEEKGFYVDPTYRQFLQKIRPDRMMIIGSEDAIPKMYSYDELYKDAKKTNIKLAESYQPYKEKPDKLYHYYYKYNEKKGSENLILFCNLVNSLKD
ncbi:MAG: hypothetical protein ACOCXQ_03915 [Patescibacteria group bacterium]